MFVTVPADRLEQARAAAAVMGDEIFTKLPFAGATKPMASTRVEMVLNRTWKPQLAVIGMDGYPLPENAGNVLLPYSTAMLSLRTPPTCDADAAVKALKRTLEADPPYGAEVSFEPLAGQSGWNAPSLTPWLEASLTRRFHGPFRQARGVHGRRRLDPLHGHAGQEVPQDPVRGDGGVGAGLQRPRPQRVPAHPVREEALGLHRGRAGGSCEGSTLDPEKNSHAELLALFCSSGR